MAVPSQPPQNRSVCYKRAAFDRAGADWPSPPIGRSDSQRSMSSGRYRTSEPTLMNCGPRFRSLHRRSDATLTFSCLDTCFSVCRLIICTPPFSLAPFEAATCSSGMDAATSDFARLLSAACQSYIPLCSYICQYVHRSHVKGRILRGAQDESTHRLHQASRVTRKRQSIREEENGNHLCRVGQFLVARYLRFREICTCAADPVGLVGPAIAGRLSHRVGSPQYGSSGPWK